MKMVVANEKSKLIKCEDKRKNENSYKTQKMLQLKLSHYTAQNTMSRERKRERELMDGEC